MATITQTKEAALAQSPRFDLDVGGWLRNNVFDSIWKTIFAVILIGVDSLIVRAGFTAEPVGLSFNLAPNGTPSLIGSLILMLTNGAFLTTVILILWLGGALAVVYSAARHHWPGPTQWLKDSLFTGPFGTLTTLGLALLLVFAIRSLLSWAVFGAEFRSNAESVTLIRDVTPGAIWGIIAANARLFAIGRYPIDVIWRAWLSLGLIMVMAALSLGAWNFGSPLKQFRKVIVWGWLASLLIIIFGFLSGVPGVTEGPLRQVSTTLWGGLMLTLVIATVGILFSFPIGVVMALGRRSEVRGVPLLWVWGAVGLVIYWLLAGFPADETTLNVPVLFRDPPIWPVTLSWLSMAMLQALVVLGVFWAIGYYFQGNMIKTFSIVYIELIRGVPLITVLFMANVMLPIFLPKELEVNNLLRVIIGVILFTAAYMAENVRGGLQAIPKGQYEAAEAVGLSTAKSMRLIILPQALRLVIPAIVGMCISLFKDTSLVALVGLFDLLNIARTIVAQPDWLGLQRETFAFVALVYWVFAFSMSRASQRLEQKLGVGKY
jgi:general L-amino acid transport system permease protein